MRSVRRSTVVAAAVLALVTGCAAPALPGSTACVRYPTPPGISVGATLVPKPPSPRADASKLKVGVADDAGGRADGPPSGTAAAGLDRAVTDLGLVRQNTTELAAVAGEGDAAAGARLEQLVTAGYDPVIAVGPTYAAAVRAAATAHPAVRFAIVDDDSVVLPNVTPLVFAEEQGAFLVGVAAAMKSTSCHIGFVAAGRTRLRQKFEAGYVQGARYVAPEIKVDISYAGPGEDSGADDPGRAAALAHDQFAGGADVVFAAAGGSGPGVFRAARAAGRLAVGVDSDQYLAPGNRDLRSVIMTSALERVDTVVHDYLAAVAADDLAPLPTRFDLGDGGVGYASSGGRIDDIDGYLQAYAVAVAAGGIKVDTTPSS